MSQTVVDPEDPAFSSPAKFVGSVHTEVEAKELTDEHDWTFARDGDGWRHVVVASRSSRGRMASRASKPSSTKDLASAHVAQQLGADLLVVLTDVPAAMADFGSPHHGRRTRGPVLPDRLDGPKVEAACRFVRATAGRAAIGAFGDAAAVFAGTAGTQVRDRDEARLR